MNEASEGRRTGVGRAIEAGLSGESVSAAGVLGAIGGWRGILESLLPATVFLVAYVLTGRNAYISAIAPLVISLLAIAWRLIRREPLASALSGLLGVAVCVAAVLFTGEGSSYFVPGFFINGAWILAYAVSLIVGWPLIGLVLGFLRGSLTEWRRVPALKRAAQLTSAVWLLMFVARLAVQLPLYFAAPPQGDDEAATEWLGLARLVMGVPLFALLVLFTWLVLARVSASVDAAKRLAKETAGDDIVGADEDRRSSDE